jgi:hypothetical protein
MTKDLYISVLRQGNNGTEILQILDNIISGESSSSIPLPVEPTSEEIAF